MRGYDRLWNNINTGIEKRKIDCLHRESISRRKNIEANIICLLEISVSSLNEFWDVRNRTKGMV